MTMNKAELEGAVRQGIITADQAERLLAFSAARPEARFSFVHVLYYLGGMIAIGAMSLFMTLAWNRLGGWGGFATALCYIVLFLALTHWTERRGLAIPAGIMATLAVVTVPLAVFSAQVALGHWSGDRPYRDYHVYIDWRWLMMEFATLAAGAILLWRYRFPFMLMPIAVTLWYMSMDLAPFLTQNVQNMELAWEMRKWVSLYFGIATVLLAFWVDVRSRASRDYAFWLYLFGVLTFWGGLSSMRSDSELNKFLYCMINLGMVLVGGVLGRRVFAVFGGIGIASYLGYLSWKVFRDSLIFPFALTLLGLAVIAVGVLWQRNEARWSAHLRAFLPAALRELLEARAVRSLAALLLLPLALWSGSADAQAFPSRQMRIVVPAPAGSSPDIRARQIGTRLAEALGQPVIIDNRPGANGMIAAREAAKAAADGHTMFLALINNAIGDALKPDPCCRLNYELLPVSRFTMTPLVMVVHPSVASTLKEFIEKAKAGNLTYASAGTGSIGSLVGEWVKVTAGIKVLEVPYKGVNAEIPDLIGGQVAATYIVPQVVVAPIKAGKLRALAVAGPARLALLPDVPTTAEAGLPGIEAIVWNGIFVPAGTPAAAIRVLHRELVQAYNAPEVKSQVEATGSSIAADTPEEFAAFVRAESAKWAKVIRDAGIKPQ